MKFTEARDADQASADDQQRPPFAYDLERPGNRAVRVLEARPAHDPRISVESYNPVGIAEDGTAAGVATTPLGVGGRERHAG